MKSKIGVTASEMLQMREQGMSNHDIAKALDISTQTVRNYIGRQDGQMEGLEAFKDKPQKKNPKKDEAPSVAVYQPRIKTEEYLEEIPDVIQFLAWAARERIKE